MWNALKAKMANKKAVSDFRKLTVQYAESPVNTTLDVDTILGELESVGGELTDVQAKYVTAAAETAIQANTSGDAVQLGASNPKATMLLASLFNKKNSRVLQVIDSNGSASNVQELAETSVGKEAAKKINVTENSFDAYFSEQKPEVVFGLIDACSDYNEALQIYRKCADHTETGALIAALDIDSQDYAGSLKAFREVLLDQPQWVLWAHCKNLAVVRREF